MCELLRTQVAGFSLDSELPHTKASNLKFVRHAEEKGERSIRNEQLEMSNGQFYLYPIDKSVIRALDLPWFEVSKDEAENVFHGKPLDMLLENKSLFSSVSSCPAPKVLDAGLPVACLCVNKMSNSAAIFCGETLIAVVEKINSKWKYACVI